MADPALIDTALADYGRELAALHQLANKRDAYLRAKVRAPDRLRELAAAIAAQRERVAQLRRSVREMLNAEPL